MNDPPLVSIIVPALDEATTLPALLDHLQELTGYFEAIVVDGGSSDATLAIANSHRLSPRVISAPRGRATQCNAGALVATGDVLLFLHADTSLPAAAYSSLLSAVADPAVLGGNFEVQFDGGDRFSRLLSAWMKLQRRAGIYYGDSVIWMRRTMFEDLGGFRGLAIMEDYDLVRRLERAGSTVCLPGPVLTSARRWQHHGLARTIGSWVLIRWLYLAGVPSSKLARVYPKIR